MKHPWIGVGFCLVLGACSSDESAGPSGGSGGTAAGTGGAATSSGGMSAGTGGATSGSGGGSATGGSATSAGGGGTVDGGGKDGGELVDSGGVDSGPTFHYVDGGPCNNLVNGAPVVNQTRVDQVLPTPTGGTISNGTYYETKSEKFTGPGGATGPDGESRQLTFQFKGGVVEIAGINGGQQATATVRITGTTVTLTPICPPGAPTQTPSFSVSGDTLLIINPSKDRVETFTKQP